MRLQLLSPSSAGACPARSARRYGFRTCHAARCFPDTSPAARRPCPAASRSWVMSERMMVTLSPVDRRALSAGRPRSSLLHRPAERPGRGLDMDGHLAAVEPADGRGLPRGPARTVPSAVAQRPASAQPSSIRSLSSASLFDSQNTELHQAVHGSAARAPRRETSRHDLARVHHDGARAGRQGWRSCCG